MDLIGVADYISVFPLVLYYAFAYLSVINIKNIKNKLEHPLLLLFLLLSSKLVNFIKSIDFKREFIYRPKGAEYCDLLSKNKVSKMRGFPSGHMSSIALFATFMILFRYYKNYDNIKDYIKKDYIYIILNLFLVLITAWARYYKKCHTILQISCGTILGILLGCICFFTYLELEKIIKNK
tara:strand:- start:296 stop:835 length:540 start_codon:yes stop_codon:yes gene_type:complete